MAHVLVDELMDAIEAYAREVGDAESVVWDVMTWTGGISRYPKVGQVPAPPPGARDKRTVAEADGHHTLVQVRDWLERLVARERWWEPFLVSSIVNAYASELDWYVNNYGANAEHRRARADEMEARQRDPEFMAGFRAALASGGVEPGVPGSELVGLIARMRQPPSLMELKEHQQRLSAWRRLTDDLVSRERYERWLEDPSID